MSGPRRRLLVRETVAAAYTEVPLRRRDGSVRAHTLIDADDYGLKLRACSLTAVGYVQTVTAAGQRYLHREVLGLRPGDGLVADHLSGDKLDNRRGNLRALTQAQNAQNTRAKTGSSSAARGVSRCPDTGAWRARVGAAWLGRHSTEQEAAQAAQAARTAMLPYTNEARYPCR